MKISRKPAPEPKFTHQFESLRIKVVTSVFFLNPLFLYPSNVSTIECSIIGRKKKHYENEQEPCSLPKLYTLI